MPNSNLYYQWLCTWLTAWLPRLTALYLVLFGILLPWACTSTYLCTFVITQPFVCILCKNPCSVIHTMKKERKNCSILQLKYIRHLSSFQVWPLKNPQLTSSGCCCCCSHHHPQQFNVVRESILFNFFWEFLDLSLSPSGLLFYILGLHI